tara:strand:+ start:413 stop:676 length:264 start_codon:yes stop_codon:yes gene_type:complete
MGMWPITLEKTKKRIESGRYEYRGYEIVKRIPSSRGCVVTWEILGGPRGMIHFDGSGGGNISMYELAQACELIDKSIKSGEIEERLT